ncbi:transcriptional regulator [Lactococcus garvieae subsp. garvieae]|uniref:transcriptional regulator n=1 Tax=Lactococcus garvieae TaxID=1363 RepID=UPI0005AA5415|nr:transcriptional regulator [Lactococcus garvieae]KAA8711981.1 transcriptional regulator [Lactococcus garvieae subsp. garvieae]MDG6191583.1 transcriptional regulator [Lactococcus garvieae]PCS00067.1 hypothetical protein RU85_GL000974 [Lactococcus garvieae]QPR49804.1 transcriptional regulator [Lactococcus garvieae]
MRKIIEYFRRLWKRLAEVLNESHHGYLNFNFVLKIFDKEDKKKSSNRVKNSEEVEAKEKEFDTQILEFNKDMEGLVTLVDSLPNSVGKTLKVLMDWRNMTEAELSEESLVGTKAISNTINGKTIPKLENMIAFCIGLSLPPILSRKFLGLAGYTLSLSIHTHIYYAIILDGCSHLRIRDCNKILEKNGVRTLPYKIEK